jgi:two-component system phosphate regulon sensor histidine kinase PhoR
MIEFLLGLAIGIGFWLWRQAWLYRQLRKILVSLQTGGAEGTSLPIVSRLRSGIDRHNRYRQELETKLQGWENLLRSAPIGYLCVDGENQLVWCNQQARQLLHVQQRELGELRLLLEVVRSYELDRLIEQTRRCQQPMQQEWLFHPVSEDALVLSELKSVTLRASSFPLPMGEVGVFLENLQPLVETSRSRDRWISDLAHELKTPLTSIQLVAENLQQRLKPPESRWVEKMLSEIDRLINLAQDFLELSHLQEDPHKHLNLKPVELQAAIASVWQTLAPHAQAKQLSWLYSGPDVVRVSADMARLTQVFLNLFDNSIKYSPVGGTIQVEVKLLPDADIAEDVQIDIVDSGSGFAEADLPRIFDRLFRGELSRGRPDFSGSRTGSGLGLAIVRQIILAHGGAIEARNHPQTGGAWLQIQLPIADREGDGNSRRLP